MLMMMMMAAIFCYNRQLPMWKAFEPLRKAKETQNSSNCYSSGGCDCLGFHNSNHVHP